jgi:hypothetical protein
MGATAHVAISRHGAMRAAAASTVSRCAS